MLHQNGSRLTAENTIALTESLQDVLIYLEFSSLTLCILLLCFISMFKLAVIFLTFSSAHLKLTQNRRV